MWNDIFVGLVDVEDVCFWMKLEFLFGHSEIDHEIQTPYQPTI